MSCVVIILTYAFSGNSGYCSLHLSHLALIIYQLLVLVIRLPKHVGQVDGVEAAAEIGPKQRLV